MTAGSQSLKWTCQTRSRNSRTAATGSPPAPNVQCPVSRHSPRIDGSVMSNRRRASRLGLDQGADVLVDHRPDPGLVHDPPGDVVGASANTRHWSAGIASDGRTRPAILRAVRVAVRVVAEDDDALGAADARQLLRGTHGVVRGLAMAARVLEPDADPGADEGQAPRVELRAQLVGIGGHEAPVPELGARVARRVHLVDDAAIAVALPVDALDDAPGARGVRDPDHAAHGSRSRGAGPRAGDAGATTLAPARSTRARQHRQADRLGGRRRGPGRRASGELLDGEAAHLGLLLGDRRQGRGRPTTRRRCRRSRSR